MRFGKTFEWKIWSGRAALASMLAWVLAWVLALTLAAAPAAAYNLPEAELQAALEASIAAHKIPGAVAKVTASDGSSWTGTAGYADLSIPARMQPYLHLHIGSLTKSLTATLMLRMVDFGLVSLEDTVEKWLPGLLKRGSEITVRNLLNMRSGLGHYELTEVFDERFISNPTYQWPPEELVRLADYPNADPDTEFDYNNANYLLAGMIIERAINLPYNVALQALILEPAGMADSSLPMDRFMPWPYAHGYLNQGGQAVDVTFHWDTSAFWAAGSLISTIDDMERWLEVLLSGSLLSESSHREQFTMVPVGGGVAGGYGMGVGQRGDFVGHAGNYNGLYTAGMYTYHGYNIVILANGQAAGAGSDADAIAVRDDLAKVLD